MGEELLGGLFWCGFQVGGLPAHARHGIEHLAHHPCAHVEGADDCFRSIRRSPGPRVGCTAKSTAPAPPRPRGRHTSSERGPGPVHPLCTRRTRAAGRGPAGVWSGGKAGTSPRVSRGPSESRQRPPHEANRRTPGCTRTLCDPDPTRRVPPTAPDAGSPASVPSRRCFSPVSR